MIARRISEAIKQTSTMIGSSLCSNIARFNIATFGKGKRLNLEKNIRKHRLLALVAASLIFTIALNFNAAIAAMHYKQQSNFAETTVPMANYKWTKDNIQGCIYKENTVPDSYYVWAKLAIQQWREALREYTGLQNVWNISAHYVKSNADLGLCDVKIYIYASYKEFPGYPMQTGAYTKVNYNDGKSRTVDGNVLDARVYLAPFVLH